MNNRVHQGHLARKRFGQNFLNDQFVIDSIVSAINPQKGQAMVEIGPGLAALDERRDLVARAAIWRLACRRIRSSVQS